MHGPLVPRISERANQPYGYAAISFVPGRAGRPAAALHRHFWDGAARALAGSAPERHLATSANERSPSTTAARRRCELLVGLRERGLDVTRPILAVLDGAKALRAAVCEVFENGTGTTASAGRRGGRHQPGQPHFQGWP